MTKRVHAMPDWQEHLAKPSCWCGPLGQWFPPNGEVWVHRANNDDPAIYDQTHDPAEKEPGRQWLVVEE
jgi:hypothetical protein